MMMIMMMIVVVGKLDVVYLLEVTWLPRGRWPSWHLTLPRCRDPNLSAKTNKKNKATNYFYSQINDLFNSSEINPPHTPSKCQETG